MVYSFPDRPTITPEPLFAGVSTMLDPIGRILLATPDGELAKVKKTRVAVKLNMRVGFMDYCRIGRNSKEFYNCNE
jgi:hypothetical protein